MVRQPDLEYNGTVFLQFEAAFAMVAVGANGRIQSRAVRMCDEILGPMVVDVATRRSTTFSAVAVRLRRSPSTYGIRTTASVFAM